MAGDVGGRSCTESELLLHPELLSQEFLLLTLEQKNITVESDVRINKDNLTDLYVQHAIPLPQRDLPKNRWGKMMEQRREHEIKSETKRSSTIDGLRKRPLIVFDGNSTSTSIKVKKTENGDNDRLKSPPQASFTSNAFQKLPNSPPSVVLPLTLSSTLPTNNKMDHSHSDTKQNHDSTLRKSPSGPMKSPPLSPAATTPVKLKRAAPKEEAEAVNNLKPPEAKRKIQHVTWP